MLRHVKFANLAVTDQDRALAFWRDKLGVSVVTDEAYGEGFRWIELELPGAQTRILFVRRRDGAPSEQPDLILICDDVNESFAELKGRGVAFTQEPSVAPWRPAERYALFRDSEGNLIMLGNS